MLVSNGIRIERNNIIPIGIALNNTCTRNAEPYSFGLLFYWPCWSVLLKGYHFEVTFRKFFGQLFAFLDSMFFELFDFIIFLYCYLLFYDCENK